jgi:hypothetical protein
MASRVQIITNITNTHYRRVSWKGVLLHPIYIVSTVQTTSAGLGRATVVEIYCTICITFARQHCLSSVFIVLGAENLSPYVDG